MRSVLISLGLLPLAVLLSLAAPAAAQAPSQVVAPVVSSEIGRATSDGVSAAANAKRDATDKKDAQAPKAPDAKDGAKKDDAKKEAAPQGK